MVVKSPQVGIIGVGRWGQHLARNYHALQALAALCDHHPEQLDRLRHNYSEVRCYADHQELLADKSVEAVVIATRAASHFALAKQALEQQKDVYVEKPLCFSVKEAFVLNQLAKQNNRILMVGHLLRYHPAILQLEKWIQAEKLGQVHYLAAHRLNLGVIGMEGSALWDLAPHDLSVILALTGDKLPRLVRCSGGAFLDAQVPDVGLATLDFHANLQAHIYFSWLNPFKEHKLTIVGSEAMAVFDDTAPWDRKLLLYPKPVAWREGRPFANPSEAKPCPLLQAEPLALECAHFLECCRTRQRPRTDSCEALRVMHVVEAAHSSLQQGGEPQIPG